MARAFSLPSETLAYFLGFVLVHSDEVAIVSPWLSNVELRLPMSSRIDTRSITLVEAIERLPDTTVHLIVRDGESHNDYIRRQLPRSQTLHTVDDLHAKAVISETFVYMGSANITRGGLSINRELCEVIENEEATVEGYLDAKLDLAVTLDRE